MAKRNINKTLISRQTLAVGETVSEHLFIGEASGLSFHVIWEGSPATAIRLQTSNDPLIGRNLETDASWFTEATTISGCNGAVADGSVVAHLDSINSSYARLKFTVTTAGTISVYGTTKA